MAANTIAAVLCAFYRGKFVSLSSLSAPLQDKNCCAPPSRAKLNARVNV